MGRIAEQFGGDKLAAVQYLANHPEVGRQVSSTLISRNAESHPNNVGDKKAIYDGPAANKERIGVTPTHNPDLDNRRNNHNIAQQERELDSHIAEKRTSTQAGLAKSGAEADQQRNLIDTQHSVSQQKYEQEKDKTLVGKTFGKADENLSDLESYQNAKDKAQDLMRFLWNKK